MINPPSIPSHDFVFGYEVQNGTVKKQDNPEKYFKGEKEDTVGPGHYNAKTQVRDPRVKTMNFGKQTSTRNAVPIEKDKDLDIAPGQYNLDKVEAFPVYKLKQSASFMSKVNRTTSYAEEMAKQGRKRNSMTQFFRSAMQNEYDSSDSDDEAQPGPGAYTTQKYSDFTVDPTPERLQFFGSKADRFPNQKTAHPNVGPGMYDMKQMAKSARGKKVPFACGDIRFRKKKLENVPGPGSYKAPTIVNDISHKTWGKKGIFGSSERRFVIKRSNIEEEKNPGPGNYNPIDSIKALEEKKNQANKRKLNANFLSKTRRENIPVKKEKSPEPYNPQNGTIADNVRKKTEQGSVPLLSSMKEKTVAPFATGGQRFKQAKIDENQKFLGPGYYEQKTFVDEVKQKKGSKFVSQEPRFQKSTGFKKQQKAMPGPGSYNINEMETWNKQSFNMMFGD